MSFPLDPRRWRVFGLTWLSYASYYLTRKNFAVAKASLTDTLGISKDRLGDIDSSYSGAYALGQVVWGAVADRIGPRRVLAFGMVATAILSLAMGFSASFWALMALYTLNGFAQATGWSPNVKAMTGWFPDEKRGAIMGIWTTNYSVGSFVANPIARVFLDAFGWQWAFFGPAVPVAIVGVVLLFFLPEKAAARRASKEAAGDASEAAATASARAEEAEKAEAEAARARLLQNPFLWSLGAAYFFMKLTRYFFLNWAPFYMEKVLHYDKDRLVFAPQMFELGGVVGAFLIGWSSDKFFKGRRVPVAVVSMIALSAGLAVYNEAASAGLYTNIAVLMFCGFFLYGPDAIVSATAAQDLGGARAAAMAAGIINGLGSVGQIAAGQLVKIVPSDTDWGIAFRILGVGTAVSAFVLAPFWNRGRNEGNRSA